MAQQQVVEWLALPRSAEAETQRRQQRKQYLTELIESIDESLGLTDAQLRKLRVACKGAVEYSCEQEAEQRPAGRWRVRPQPAAPAAWPVFRAQAAVVGQDAAAAAKHSIWTKTLERMVTPEELAKVKSLEQQQLAKLDPRQRLLELRMQRRLEAQQRAAIQLRAFQRVNINKLLIHPVWPQPIIVENPRD